MKETTPLKWPGNWPRVLPENQETRSQWKKALSDSRRPARIAPGWGIIHEGNFSILVKK